MWLDALRKMKADSGLTTDEIAERSGIPGPTLEKLFAGTTKEPKLPTMSKLVHFFGHTLDDLEEAPPAGIKNAPSFSERAKFVASAFDGLDAHGKRLVELVIRDQQDRMRSELPVLSGAPDNVTYLQKSRQPVSAGTGVYLGPEDMEIIQVQENDLTRRASFCVPVSGDSMEPLYHDRDILLVEGCEDIPVGKIGVFTVDGDGYVKKRGNRELISLNPAYAPVPMVEGETWCNGLVIGVLDPSWIVG